MHTTTVGLAVTPTIFSTLLSHYLKRKRLAHKPTAHLSYDEGLHLVRSFLVHASHHTVEELQAFTSQWVPHPQWVRVDHVEIPEKDLLQAADLLAEQLGPDGIRQVGGKQWWQWRMPRSPLKAEWIEMKGDYQERKKNTDLGNRVMLYVHGGAYYFGSVDEHRYQIQRHARKLKARALAPRYRLAPQFPFPCGLQDCLATYLYLISQKKPSSIILAGDSAGAGMVLSMMVILRDRGIPLPAGAVLISPWVDLTHSFPSVAGDCPLDYIPPSGFHHKSSEAWPPPDEEELEELKKAAMAQKKEMPGQHGETAEQKGIPTAKDVAEATHRLTFLIDGEQVEVKEQIQMYTTNELLAHPLVSPIMQPTLGGLPPLLIMVGGGELLRDEQIYLAHKCANPAEYLPPEALMDEKMKALVDRYRPTDVQLQVWDDLCHVAPTLSFTKPAKFMYRSVAQFSAWALGRAQKTEVDILNDDQISVVSDSASSASDSSSNEVKEEEDSPTDQPPKHHHHHHHTSVGKAGDPLPPFTNHMIRQRVTRHGAIHPLPPAPSLPGCCMARDLVGVVKVGTVRKWLAHKRRWDARFGPTKARVHRRRLRDVAVGYEVFGAGEVPPPSALAGRRRRVDVGVSEGAGGLGEGEKKKKKKREKGLGLSLWALWGSKHDEMAVQRERDAGRGAAEVAAGPGQGLGAGSLDLRPAGPLFDGSKGGHGEGEEGGGGEEDLGGAHAKASFLSPDDHGTGVTGKRVFIGGLATPFSMHKEHDTASMITLASAIRPSTADSSSAVAASSVKDVSADTKRVGSEELDKDVSLGHGSAVDATPGLETAFVTPFLSPASPGERPGLERFVTADEKPLN